MNKLNVTEINRMFRPFKSQQQPQQQLHLVSEREYFERKKVF